MAATDRSAPSRHAPDPNGIRGPVQRFTRLSLLWISVITLSAAVGITYLAGTAMIERELQLYGQLIAQYVDDEVSADTFDKVQESEHPRLHSLFQSLLTFVQVERLKVLARDGMIVWSNDPSSIGRREPASQAFQTALKGEVDAYYRHEALEPAGRPLDMDSLWLPMIQGIYIPVRSGTADVLGVVEVYRLPVFLLRELQVGLLVLWSLLLSAGVAYFLMSRRLVAKTAVELVTAQSRLEYRRRLASVGECVGFIVHDTRNLLSALRMACDRIGRGGMTAEQQKELAQTVHLPLEMSYAMMNDLLDFLRGRSSSLQHSPQDLAEVLERGRPLLDAQVERGGHALRLKVPTGLVVAADPQKLLHVFINLVRNSANAMPKPGQVEIEARATGAAVQVTVRDTGPGIAPDKLFTLFTGEDHGSGSVDHGLGLAIVHDLVVRHGGTVSARNLPQGGTEFILSLPQVPDATNLN
jgi:signal transduction histidine kinase